MSRLIILDSGPLGLVTQRLGIERADACREWVLECTDKVAQVLVPEIADYEVRRELLRARKTAGVARLDRFIAAAPQRYLPLTTQAVRKAAELWADARNRGVATADIHALDGDVILAAQVLTLDLAGAEIIVATDNVRHLSRYVTAVAWSDFEP